MSLPPALEPAHFLTTLLLFGIFLWCGWDVYRAAPFGRPFGTGLVVVGSGLVAVASSRLVQLDAFGPRQGFVWTGYDWQVEMAMIGAFLGIAAVVTGLAFVVQAASPIPDE